MRHSVDTAIGGYFAREPVSPHARDPFRPGELRFQSARAAMAAALQSSGHRRVWVPHFICGAVLDAIAWAGAEACRYRLDQAYAPPAELPVGEHDGVICVDYFGLSATACDLAIRRFGSHRVLVDASQAMFHDARPGTTTVYSPRKFAGFPDGGLLVAPRAIPPPLPADEAASRQRSQHLDLRAAGDVAGGYAHYQQAEASLQDCSPRAMSIATSKALDATAWDAIGARRRANYRVLAEALARTGWQTLPLPADAVPLCCPVIATGAVAMRERLALDRIYTPAFWPDSDPPADDPVGRALRDGTVYLPCDQRYDGEAMLMIAKSVDRHGRGA